MTMRDGAALARARQLFGLTVDDMAARLGLPVMELSEIEDGRRDLTIKTRNKIEQVMGFNLDDFAPNPNHASAKPDARGDAMTPDEHAARADELAKVADSIYHDAFFDNEGEGRLAPEDHEMIRTLSALGQLHAALSLRQPTPRHVPQNEDVPWDDQEPR